MEDKFKMFAEKLDELIEEKQQDLRDACQVQSVGEAGDLTKCIDLLRQVKRLAAHVENGTQPKEKDIVDKITAVLEQTSFGGSVIAPILEKARKEIVNLRALGEDYEQAMESKRILTRKLDWLLNGSAAAQQAALCDVVSQVEREQIRSENYKE